MTDDQVANAVNVLILVCGMWFAVIIGYKMGYRDGYRDRDQNKESRE